jgi:hypothetical protein
MEDRPKGGFFVYNGFDLPSFDLSTSIASRNFLYENVSCLINPIAVENPQ